MIRIKKNKIFLPISRQKYCVVMINVESYLKQVMKIKNTSDKWYKELTQAHLIKKDYPLKIHQKIKKIFQITNLKSKIVSISDLKYFLKIKFKNEKKIKVNYWWKSVKINKFLQFVAKTQVILDKILIKKHHF